MRLYLYRRGGKGNWIIRGTSTKGVSIFETTKTTSELVASRLLTRRQKEVDDESVFGAKAVRTFDQAAESYLDAGGSKRFLGKVKAGKWTGVIGAFSNQPLHKITQSDLDRAAIDVYPGARPETRNRQFYTPFVAVWNHAVGNDWADYRKWKRPKKPKGTNVVIRPSGRTGNRPTSYDRAAEFVAAMSPANAIVMTILFYTGMRPIELFSMDCSHVNVKARWITLPASKTGEPRGVPIHSMLVPLMAGLVKRGGRVVRQWNGSPFVVRENCGGQMKKAIAGARDRSGILDISPYTARHTVSTQLVINGVHSHIKDQILGHASDDMSRLYTNVPRKELIAAIDTLPVVLSWAATPWIKDPVGISSKYANPVQYFAAQHPDSKYDRAVKRK